VYYHVRNVYVYPGRQVRSTYVASRSAFTEPCEFTGSYEDFFPVALVLVVEIPTDHNFLSMELGHMLYIKVVVSGLSPWIKSYCPWTVNASLKLPPY
jgi:hypothetical protein